MRFFRLYSRRFYSLFLYILNNDFRDFRLLADVTFSYSSVNGFNPFSSLVSILACKYKSAFSVVPFSLTVTPGVNLSLGVTWVDTHLRLTEFSF